MAYNNPPYDQEIYNPLSPGVSENYYFNYFIGWFFDESISYASWNIGEWTFAYGVGVFLVETFAYPLTFNFKSDEQFSYRVRSSQGTNWYGNYGKNALFYNTPIWSINDGEASIYAQQLILNTDQKALKNFVFTSEYNHKKNTNVYSDYRMRDSNGNHVATLRKRTFYTGFPGKVRVYLNHTLNNQQTTSDWVFHVDYSYGKTLTKFETRGADLPSLLFNIKNGTDHFEVIITGLDGEKISSIEQLSNRLADAFGTVGDPVAFDVYLVDSNNSVFLALFKSMVGPIKIIWDLFYRYIDKKNPVATNNFDLETWEKILGTKRASKFRLSNASTTINSVVYENVIEINEDITTSYTSPNVTCAGGNFTECSEGDAIRKPNGEFLGYISSIADDENLTFYANATETYSGEAIATTNHYITQIEVENSTWLPEKSFLNVKGEQLLYREKSENVLGGIERAYNGVYSSNLVGETVSIWKKKYLAKEPRDTFRERTSKMLKNDCSVEAMRALLDSTTPEGGEVEIWDLYTAPTTHKVRKRYDRGWLASILNNEYGLTKTDIDFIKTICAQIDTVYRHHGETSALIITDNFANIPMVALGAFVYQLKNGELKAIGRIVQTQKVTNYLLPSPSGGHKLISQGMILWLDRDIHVQMENNPYFEAETVYITTERTDADSMTIAQHQETVLGYMVDYSGYWNHNVILDLVYKENPSLNPNTRRFCVKTVGENNPISGEFPFFIHTKGYSLDENYIREFVDKCKAAGTTANFAHNKEISFYSVAIAEDSTGVIAYEIVG